MPAITSTTATGNPYVDGVLSDVQWAVNSFTFSFPTSGSYYGSGYGSGENITNFGATTFAQQAGVRAALNNYASVANLTFTEIQESSVQHADLRFAMSDSPSTAWAYYPSTASEGGDAWFNKSSGYYASPDKGNYAYLTMLHEIGHSLGLEHAHEGGVPLDRDSMEYTVMSYRSFVGASLTSGYTNEVGGYAQSLMMFDIAAIQHAYGANFTTNGANTVYTWSPTTGQAFVDGVGQGAPVANRIFQTIWDGGGVDTYDFSNYSTNLKINLNPGEWTTTSTSQLAKLSWDGSHVAVGNIANALLYEGDLRSMIENAVGGSGSDMILGNLVANDLKGGAGDDTLIGNAGDDVLDGGTGVDTASYSGQISNYALKFLADGSLEILDLRVGAADGRDVLWNMEYLQFTDQKVSVQSLVEPITPTTSPPLTVDTNLAGDAYANTLMGTDGANVIDGKGGADKLYGAGGNDTLIGGSGADWLDGGSGVDTASYQTATAAVTSDLSGRMNSRGDAKGDTYVSVENLTGSAFADILSGNDESNLVSGGGGDDVIYGRGGADTLNGEEGADQLFGGAGADTLIGGAGADVFIFQTLSDSAVGAADTLTDFTRGLDRIDLRSIDANINLRGDQAFNFIGTGSFTGQAGQLHMVNGVVSGDVNGDGIADFEIKVLNVTLSATDFYL